MPFFAPAVRYSSRATLAEAVVLSTYTAPSDKPAKMPSFTQHDVAQVVVVAHAGEREVRTLHGLPWRVRTIWPPCSATHGLRLGRRAVVHRDLVTARLEVPGHRIPHDSQTNKGYFSHTDSSCARASESNWLTCLLLKLDTAPA